MKSGKRKIAVGDWVITPKKEVGQVVFSDGERLTVCDGGWWASACTKLPASPADMAKVYRMAARIAYLDDHFRFKGKDAAVKQLIRLTTKQSRRGGEGEVEMKPSNRPQVIAKNRTWYYEDKRGIDVVKWENGRVVHLRIPWNRLMASAKRCGRKLP